MTLLTGTVRLNPQTVGTVRDAHVLDGVGILDRPRMCAMRSGVADAGHTIFSTPEMASASESEDAGSSSDESNWVEGSGTGWVRSKLQSSSKSRVASFASLIISSVIFCVIMNYGEHERG